MPGWVSKATGTAGGLRIFEIVYGGEMLISSRGVGQRLRMLDGLELQVSRRPRRAGRRGAECAGTPSGGRPGLRQARSA
jgi:hypothetical protein